MCLSEASAGWAVTGAGPASKSAPAPGLVGVSLPCKTKIADLSAAVLSVLHEVKKRAVCQ